MFTVLSIQLVTCVTVVTNHMRHGVSNLEVVTTVEHKNLKNQGSFSAVSSSLLRKICVIRLYAVEFFGVNFVIYVAKNKRLQLQN
jgi:hypothetical protein